MYLENQIAKGNTANIYLSNNKVIKVFNLSIDIQMKIHNVEVEEFELMNNKFIRQINDAKLLDNMKKENLINRLNNMQYDRKLCHGDFHVFNIIMQNEKPFVIDWVDSSSGDIIK